MKSFVLDTNVILHDPRALFAFEGSEVILPLPVIEELDTFKRNKDERGRSARQVARTLDRLRKKGRLSDGVELEAVTCLRGRTLPNQYIRIDDAQNLTSHEMKTVISRVGMGSKIVLTGDPYQIDNYYLDSASNGLTYVVDRFKGQQLFGHVMFSKIERSPLAALASDLL